MMCVPANDVQLRTPIESRIEGLDAFRGAAVAAMLLIINPGNAEAVWWPLRSAEWHGWTPADLLFPIFLLIVGVTTELSRKDPWPILKRGLLLIVFGLLLNAFPFFWQLGHLRFPGVLQRIGIVYILSAFIAYAFEASTYQMPRDRIEASAMRRLGDPRIAILAIAAAILIVDWFALGFGPLEPPGDTVAAQVDRALIGSDHLWEKTRTWDPEGPLSTIPAVATTLIGIIIARWVRASKVKELTIAGVFGLVAGWLWGLVFPINRSLWTSSFVIFSAGVACIVLAFFVWTVDVKGRRGWARPLIVLGLNPLVAFAGSVIVIRLLNVVRAGGVSLQELGYRTLFQPYFEAHVASFLWALSFALVWLAILWLLARRGIAVRV